VVACGSAPAPDSINDPFEAANRRVHALNRGLDRALLRPASKAYSLLPKPVEKGVQNFAANLDAPGDVLNNLLQGRVAPAAQNTLRFATNTIFGIGGLFDTATALGLPAAETDFGTTLHVWGLGEGNYVELPLLGPSTTRDAAGTAVDFLSNPVRHVLVPPASRVATAAKVGSVVGDRARYGDSFDAILYESADSYAQLRLFYLQNRRFELGQADAGVSPGPSQDSDDFLDPYEDPYGP
jgi:phospholipid-binding lipoprotein MlaA